jgi:hypothetical protein
VSGRALLGATATAPCSDGAIRKRAARAWAEANARERELAEEEGRDPDLLEPILLHECRHTFASLMIAAGVNAKALSVYMGHSSITITLDRYGHLMPGNEVEAAVLSEPLSVGDLLLHKPDNRVIHEVTGIVEERIVEPHQGDRGRTQSLPLLVALPKRAGVGCVNSVSVRGRLRGRYSRAPVP